MNKLPNLDTLRFVAASLVMIHHIELYKRFYNLHNLWHIPFVDRIGKLGVVLFFVLSGFLITHLLLNEKERTATIDIRKFYLRRIVRIWPLYYLIVFLGFVIIPHIDFFKIPTNDTFSDVLQHRTASIWFYLSIFANLGVAVFGEIPYTSQTWSLATEEQFYLLWPLFIKSVKEYFIPFLMLVLFCYWGLLYVFEKEILCDTWVSFEVNLILRKFWIGFSINCLAIGALFAYLDYKSYKLVRLIFSKFFFLTAITICLFALSTGFTVIFFHYDFYSILFGIIILNLARNERYHNVLENRITNYLGRISYGLYMYHLIALTIGVKLGAHYHSPFLLVYCCTFAITIGIAALSYRYFELPFIKMKSRFQS